MTEQQKNKKINQILEDMCIYGEITKREIKKEKKEHPEKFVETSQALNMEKKSRIIRSWFNFPKFRKFRN